MMEAPPHIDGDHSTDTEMTRAIEVLQRTTQRAVGIMRQGARDVIHRGARLIVEKFGKSTRVGLARKALIAICHRTTKTMVSTTYHFH